MKRLAIALVTAVLALGVLTAPAFGKETSWGCPSCRVSGR